jgi:hypothetical protein
MSSSDSLKLPPVVPPLLLSTCLSLITSVLYLKAERESWNFGVFIVTTYPPMFGGYYLVRYTLRLPFIRHQAREGIMWPAVQLFPGREERIHYMLHPFLAFLVHVFLGACGFITGKRAGELSLQEDGSDIILLIAWWLEAVVMVIVGIHAMVIVASEDAILCSQAHSMECKVCSVSDEDRLHMKTPLPNRLRVHPAAVLIFDVLLLAVMVRELQNRLGEQAEASIRKFYPYLAAVCLHHFYLLVNIARSTRARRAAPWPSTPIITGSGNHWLYSLGLRTMGSLQIGLIIGVSIRKDHGWRFWRGALGHVFWGCFMAILIMSGFADFATTKMWEAEAAARCLRDGHQWQCRRICSLPTANGKQILVSPRDVENDGADMLAVEVRNSPAIQPARLLKRSQDVLQGHDTPADLSLRKV